jgi:hypothetical protein
MTILINVLYEKSVLHYSPDKKEVVYVKNSSKQKKPQREKKPLFF